MEAIILLIVAALIFFIIQYNGIVKRKNQVENSFSSIDVMLRKRYDLIPNLVEIAKGYLNHEKEVLSEVTRLRTDYLKDPSSDGKVLLDGKICQAMELVRLSVENYPDLKAGENFIQLQKIWNETEDYISASRRFYNSSVTEYNTRIEQFPSSIIASLFGFKRKEVFEIITSQREAINTSITYH